MNKQVKGVTLRDWFAGQALVGLWASPITIKGVEAIADLARIAYRQADAMIAARSAGKQEVPICGNSTTNKELK